MRKIRLYDREALFKFYETEFPDANVMTDWYYLEGPDRRISLAFGDTGGVFPEVEERLNPPVRVQRALAECPYNWVEIDEPPIEL